MRQRAISMPLVRKVKESIITIHCETHPENFGEWHSPAEMEQEKHDLAKRIGVL
jgi:hypothetical protein